MMMLRVAARRKKTRIAKKKLIYGIWDLIFFRGNGKSRTKVGIAKKNGILEILRIWVFYFWGSGFFIFYRGNGNLGKKSSVRIATLDVARARELSRTGSALFVFGISKKWKKSKTCYFSRTIECYAPPPKKKRIVIFFWICAFSGKKNRNAENSRFWKFGIRDSGFFCSNKKISIFEFVPPFTNKRESKSIHK
jgi:hypothetical protein